MATATHAPLIRYLRRLATPLANAISDAELLRRFTVDRDADSFSVLVGRHGPLVLAACRRVLADGHAAEDCFQATFLVLARKAASVISPDSLGPWLYGVAVRTALKARSQAARRQVQERKAAVREAVEPADELVWRDLRPVLDEAIGRLAEKYRAPLVLCCLEGVSVAEAARRLGCPQGTAAARLARAKEKLRTRLARRGVTLSAAAFMAALSGKALSACVPTALRVSTAKAAAVAAGQATTAGVASATAAVLAHGGGNAMFMTKVKVVAALLLVLGLAASGALLRGQKMSVAQAATGGELTSERAAVAATPDGEQDFRMAEFFQRTGHPGSACFYYEIVCRRYPGSPLAEKSADRLRELRETPAQKPKEKKGPPKRMPPAEDDRPASAPVEPAADPFAAKVPTARQLIAYLNENAKRMPVLQAEKVTMDVKDGNQSIGLEGRFVIHQPHEVRVKFNCLGQPALDLGSNDQGWWAWFSKAEPPMSIQAKRKDLMRGTATDWPLLIGPETLVWIMSMKTYDEATAIEVIERPKTIEFVEMATSPSGKPLRRVTVFQRSRAEPGEPQIIGYRVEDAKKQEQFHVVISQVSIDGTTGAVVPNRLELIWPVQKIKIAVRVYDPKVETALKEGRAIQLFTPPPVVTEPRATP